MNPFCWADEIKESFIQYILDTHQIHDSEFVLKKKFQEAVRQFEQFVREPLVSCVPSYQQAENIEQLFNRKTSPRLNAKLQNLDPRGFNIKRPLYVHQIEAIEKIQCGRNVVITTGTGSGKTECFLLPILNELIDMEEDGVRAVFIYPMNALANDQLERLRTLIGNTSITFGRYTSQTPKDGRDAAIQKYDIPKNERFTREQIQKTPPHILITNFAMLEYLMLRPQDQDIFRHGKVKYIVLDEAHSYAGAQGIDIGMLMRRFRNLFPLENAIQFILTSATLGDGKDSVELQKICSFASKLCGSSFEHKDIIFSTIHNPFDEVKQRSLSNETLVGIGEYSDVSNLSHILADIVPTKNWLISSGFPEAEGDRVEELLYNTLKKVDIMRSIYDLLQSKPTSISEIADIVLAGRQIEHKLCVNIVSTLMNLASIACPAFAHAGRLMSVRVHHFFRGLPGASVELVEKNGCVFVNNLYLEDRRKGEDGILTLPLSSCIHCGMPVVIIVEENGRWRVPTGFVNEKVLLLTWFNFNFCDDNDDEENNDDMAVARPVYLSLSTGEFSEEKKDGFVQLMCIITETSDGNLSKCPCCHGTSQPFPSVLRRFYTSEDAPTALLAEELIRKLPSINNQGPAGGRQLLAFSDSRQRAAHFAPLLSRTVSEPGYIQPLVEAVKIFEQENRKPGSVRQIIELTHSNRMRADWIITQRTDWQKDFSRYEVKRRQGIDPDNEELLKEELATILYKHIAASSIQKTKIFGLMLIARDIILRDDEWINLESTIPELFMNPQVGRDAVARLLLSLVSRYAVKYWPSTINVSKLIAKVPAGRICTVAETVNGNAMLQNHQRIRWNPYTAPENRRRNAVLKSRTVPIIREALSFNDSKTEEQVAIILRRLWDWLTEHERVLHSVYPNEYQLPAGRIILRDKVEWYKCARCGAATIHPMTGRCEIFGCNGKLQKINDVNESRDRKHYASRYTREPLPLVVREHTAQLTLDKGKEYQQLFMNGEVNVLSSSTTFELGIDVGQLYAVLLRNVPPTAANYIQRAGRAGRRTGTAAYTITYSRNIPHDQHHYFRPQDIIRGKISVPVIYTANTRLTQRHINSLLLGRFLYANRENLSKESAVISIGEFFPIHDQNSLATLYTSWCNQHYYDLIKQISVLIPQDCKLKPENALVSSCNTLYSGVPECVYVKGLADVLRSYREQGTLIEKEIDECLRKQDNRRTIQLLNAKTRLTCLEKQLLDTHIIDFLSECHWLPSYAFPQDIVKLLVRNVEGATGMRLERDRERGISEYAPGSEIIADSKLFTSVGINLAHREPELKWFSTNPITHQIHIADTFKKTPSSPRPIRFIEPCGFTTMWDASAEEPNLFRLKPPTNSEVFLQDGVRAEDFVACSNLPGVMMGWRKGAKLFRANLGKHKKGFSLCLSCGLDSEMSNNRNSHITPWGSTCFGSFVNVALAHVLESDVMQIRFSGVGGTPDVTNGTFWMTMTTAFLNSCCRVLDIDANDLDGTYRSLTDSDINGEIVIYERIPGGVGHTERIGQHLKDILHMSLATLENCSNPECDPNSSCYACLKSYRNQFNWNKLQRNIPCEWLKKLLSQSPS